MEEQIRPRLNDQAARSGLGNPLGSAAGNDMAMVAAGPYAEQLPVANTSVRQVRAIFGDRFDIDPRSQALLDGREVGEDEVVRAGQLLMFTHRAGEKGSLARVIGACTVDAFQILIEGETARTRTPEGGEKSMALSELLRQALPGGLGTGEMILPDGVKALLAKGRLVLCVHQIPPRTYHLKWIAADSKKPFGQGAQYRTVRISLPYLVLLELFGPGPGGRLTLLNNSECFFRRKSLVSLDDELLFPALLNCSKFDPPAGKPMAWICSQNLDRSFDLEPNEGMRLWKAHGALLHCLLETGFNLSSEHHEGNSWFQACRHIDPRISSIEAWEAATHQDPFFVLETPWLPTGLSVRLMAERIFQINGGTQGPRLDAARLVRTILNQR